MSSLLSVFRRALKYRFTVAAVVVCSLLVGACWSAHIGTIYPVMKIVLYGKSIAASLEDELQVLEEKAAQLRLDRRRQATDGERKETGSTPQSDIGSMLPGLVRQASSRVGDTPQLAAIEAKLVTQRWRVEMARRWLPDRPLATMFVVVLVLLAVTVVKGICMATHEMLIASLSNRVQFDMRKQLYRHSLRMDLATIQNDRASKLMAYFTHHINLVGSGLMVLFGPLLREPIKIVFCLIGAAIVSWKLLLVSMAVAPLGNAVNDFEPIRLVFHAEFII